MSGVRAAEGKERESVGAVSSDAFAIVVDYLFSGTESITSLSVRRD